jgi:hypothetical protein
MESGEEIHSFQVLLTEVSFFRQCRQVTPAAAAVVAGAAAAAVATID